MGKQMYQNQAYPDPDDYKSVAYHNFMAVLSRVDIARKEEKHEAPRGDKTPSNGCNSIAGAD
jgi:hypothetical protein